MITGHLYGGDRETRCVQEMVLGIGGVRLLRQLDIEPHVFHLNEGHSAFLTLELARELTAEGQAVRGGRRRGAPPLRVHDAHAGRRRARRVRRAARRGVLRRGLLEGARPLARRVPEPRAREGGQRRGAVRADAARAADDALDERRQPQARRGVARAVAGDVAGQDGRGGADHLRHQRRARADVGRAFDPLALRAARRPGLGRGAVRRRIVGGQGGRDLGRGTLEGEAALEAQALRLRAPAPLLRAHAAGRVAGVRRGGAPALRLRRADHRLRAPRRGLQALGLDARRPGAAAPPDAGRRAPRAVRLRGQGPPAGSGREAHPPAARAVEARPAGDAARRLPTGLRSGDRAQPRAVGGRVAQRPAPARSKPRARAARRWR